MLPCQFFYASCGKVSSFLLNAAWWCPRYNSGRENELKLAPLTERAIKGDRPFWGKWTWIDRFTLSPNNLSTVCPSWTWYIARLVKPSQKRLSVSSESRHFLGGEACLRVGNLPWHSQTEVFWKAGYAIGAPGGGIERAGLLGTKWHQRGGSIRAGSFSLLSHQVSISASAIALFVSLCLLARLCRAENIVRGLWQSLRDHSSPGLISTLIDKVSLVQMSPRASICSLFVADKYIFMDGH
jgi:hypothetical protein